MNDTPKMPMVWQHKDATVHMVPLDPDRKVFGDEKDYYVITDYAYGSHFMVKASDGLASLGGLLHPILTQNVRKLYESNKWRYARDIWPEQYVPVPMQSPCCSATIEGSRGDGVMIGSCSNCGKSVVRQNPKTGVQEWLDGRSPWEEVDFRPVMLVG